jgi:hypothetical protein
MNTSWEKSQTPNAEAVYNVNMSIAIRKHTYMNAFSGILHVIQESMIGCHAVILIALARLN